MSAVRLIIPVKPLRASKSRLGSVLEPAEREALSRRFLDHLLSVASTFPGAQATNVVSRDAAVLEIARGHGVKVITESEDAGLNGALAEALAVVDAAAEHDILILPADLPSVTTEDVRAACRPPVCLAPDARGTGTNALFMAAPHRIPFRFGPGSLARHTEESRRMGLEPTIARRPGIAFDVDTAEDYARFTAGSG